MRTSSLMGLHAMSNLLLEDGSADRRHRPHLSDLLADSSGVVRIATAYLTERQFLSGVSEREVRLLISLTPMDVASGATSLEALRALVQMGVKCRTLPDRPRLHAKVYIFGESCAVITSANLTTSAFDSNVEVGIETSSSHAAELLIWFDQLWELAQPLTIKRISDLQRDTAALRAEFAKWKRRVKAKSKSRAKPADAAKKQPVFSDTLQEALETATQFFVCNTDRRQKGRTSTGGYILEEAMHDRGFAAAWEEFNYPAHMEMVEPGAIIFMFAKAVGIIGIGVAEGTCETLRPNQPGRVSHVHNTVEWRVPARWLAWTDSNGAFAWKSPNCTFWDVSGPKYDDFRGDVTAHFLESD